MAKYNEDEIEELKEEIKLLKIRVKSLEDSNRTRKIFEFIKIIVFIVIVIIGILYAYDLYERLMIFINGL